MNQMLRPQAMRQLTDALDRAVASNPALAGARQILLQPLKMLEAVGQEMGAALASQPAALDRLRLLLQLSAATALDIKRAFESTSDETVSAHHGRPCEGSVIRMGGLVVAGLAAGRVGRRMNDKLAEQMVDVIHGVALSASPAESLARSLQNGLSSDQVTAALDGLVGGDAALTRISAMAPVFLDACERARWDCLRHLFQIVKRQVHMDWEGSVSSTVREVQRAKKSQHASLVVHLTDDDEAAEQLAALEKKDAVCVLASADGCMTVAPSHIDRKHRVVTLSLPTLARAGCIGVATREGRRAAIATREEVVKIWEREADARNDCLRGAGVPFELIAPDSSAGGVYPPPPLARASWGVRIIDATVTRDSTPPTLTVSLARADEADRVVAHLAGASQPLTLTIDGGEASAPLPSALALAQVSGTVSVYAKDRADPDDERKVFSAAPTFSTSLGTGTGAGTAPRSTSGGAAGSVPGPDGGAAGDAGGASTSGGATTTARRRYVAVIRPVFVLPDGKIDRVSADQVPTLQKALSSVAVVEELPFVRDDELIVTGPLGDVAGPAAALMLEKLATLAARTSGLEDATLLALVPTSAVSGRIAFTAAPCDAVTAVVVATPAGAQQGITPVVTAPPARDNRLRIVGRIFRDDIVLTEPLRETIRAAGPGAPYLTPFVAVGLDDAGEALIASRIRVMGPSRSGPFAILLPVMPQVSSVELRYQPETLAVELRAQPETVFANLASIDGPILRMPTDPASMFAPMPTFLRPPRGPLPVLSRPTGQPSVSIAAASPTSVQWNANHTRGIRAQIEIEVGRQRADGGMVWSRLDGLGAGPPTERAALGLERPLPGPGLEKVRVVASDGWHVALGDHALAVAPGALRIRTIDAQQYWLDLAAPKGGDISWSVWDPAVFAQRQAPSMLRSAATGLAPRRKAVASDITRVFPLQDGDGGSVLLASYDGHEDFITLPAART